MLWKFYISVTLYPYFPVVVIIICQSFIYCYIIFAVLYFCYKKPIHIECVSFFFCIGDYHVIVILFISFCEIPIKFSSKIQLQALLWAWIALWCQENSSSFFFQQEYCMFSTVAILGLRDNLIKVWWPSEKVWWPFQNVKLSVQMRRWMDGWESLMSFSF